MKIKCLLLAGLLLAVTGCAVKENWKEYKNRDFGFAVVYPANYKAKELKWVKEATGAALESEIGAITVQAMPTGTNYRNIPFDDYVRMAAAVEIQNYTRLLSIQPFVSDYGVKGYQAYWEFVQHEDTDAGEVNEVLQAAPIYYFPPRGRQKLGDQPVKTIMIYCSSPFGKEHILTPEAEEIAKSFRYLNSFQSLFKKGHHGKVYFVRKDENFKIELAGNITTGYNWFITQMDGSMFKVEGSGYEPPSVVIPGAGGTCYFDIAPLREGVSTIRLRYYRVWEGQNKAVDDYIIRIMVVK